MSEFQIALENDAIRQFSSLHPILKPLASQIGQIETRNRKYTGIGFVTELTLNEIATPIAFRDDYLFAGAVTGECDEMAEGFFLDFRLEGGFVTGVEGMSNGDRWKVMSPARLTSHHIAPLCYLDPYLNGSGG